MFSKEHMTIGSWWLFYLLMCLPLVNIVVYILILLSSNSNKSLRSYLWASLLPLVIVVILFFTLGMGSLVMGNH